MADSSSSAIFLFKLTFSEKWISPMGSWPEGVLFRIAL
jgi:hypothetical protein